MTEIETKATAHILSCIDPSGYDEVAETEADKITFLYHTFMAEYGYMVDRVGIAKAFVEYYAGLPSCCTVEWRNHEILKLATVWGMLPEDASESQEDNVLENWFGFMAQCTVKLFRRYNLI